MANKKSAEKRDRKAAQRTLRNRVWKSSVRTAIRKARTVTASPEAADTVELLKKAYSVIDRAASKGVLHKNAAARKKSRLARRLATVAGA